MTMSAGQIITRDWWGVGIKKRPVKKHAFGFSVQVDGRQVRRFNSEWKTAEDAAKGLAAFQLGLVPSEPVPASAPAMTLGQAAERYLQVKSRKKSVKEDARILSTLKKEFGEIPLADLTAARISAYKARRLAITKSKQGGALSTASINRPLALLRHLLRLAHEEWEAIAAVPKIRLEKEPQGRVRWLKPEEEQRLLLACRGSSMKHLASFVTVALETGMRKRELFDLDWSQVDFSRGVIMLEFTKSGRRREIPMRQIVHDVLSDLPGPHEGRVWPRTSIRTAFERAVAQAKLNAPFTLHCTRHHFASWYVMRGGALPALQQILGHASLAMTMRYSHLAPDHLRSEMLKTERSGADQHIISTKLLESAAPVA